MQFLRSEKIIFERENIKKIEEINDRVIITREKAQRYSKNTVTIYNKDKGGVVR